VVAEHHPLVSRYTVLSAYCLITVLCVTNVYNNNLLYDQGCASCRTGRATPSLASSFTSSSTASTSTYASLASLAWTSSPWLSSFTWCPQLVTVCS